VAVAEHLAERGGGAAVTAHRAAAAAVARQQLRFSASAYESIVFPPII